MANRVEDRLSQELFDCFQSERFVTVATVDKDTGGPAVTSLSWVIAKDEKTLYLAVDKKSRMVENIQQHASMAVNVLANETSYTITGLSKIKEETLNGVPLKLALLELSVKEVRDVMFYGSKIVQYPEYDKTYDKKAAEKLDIQVMKAMKEA
ncbi:hypothetical protein Q73_04845 [Bacillus coahuilensis m2-6]|uniref:pyridoxamine 5'-phosphate oxidase family protein n=1 Tax=Bacillus coahuilensis TaxID=408580 RepID=UPI0002DFBFC4|nr:pyridoxamine 5'-phosphate oxidase family protein [Bacillus coahuilensis]KUP08805.1 hypothetical protein Q73_04845 [Bacillus coahuilensis m2-6]